MKVCSSCKRSKPRNEFYACRSNADGLQSRCKSCHLAANRDWVRRNPQKRREAMKRQYSKEIENGRRRSKTLCKEKADAHRAVYLAIKSGQLHRPDACPSCGATKFPIQAHHEDYSNPLIIKWLCAPCHGDVHAGRVAA